jgi:MoxR-like ATPase
MMKVYVDYPSFEAEKNILTMTENPLEKLKSIVSTDDFLEMKERVNSIYVDEKTQDYIVRLIHATRPGDKNFLSEYEGAILAGASPRASIWLYKLGRFRAFMSGKDYVPPDDILQIVPILNRSFSAGSST